jgi:hypothetical protein
LLLLSAPLDMTSALDTDGVTLFAVIVALAVFSLFDMIPVSNAGVPVSPHISTWIPPNRLSTVSADPTNVIDAETVGANT